MPDSHPKKHFGQLTGKEQTLAIQEASENTHRQPHVIEKDIWVVQAMTTLFDAPVDALEKRINACAMSGSDREPSPDAPGRQAVSTPPEETPQG